MTTPNQRRFFLLGGLAAVAAGWKLVPRAYDYLSAGFDFTPLDSPAGFRELARGEISSVLDVFAGLDSDDQRDVSHLVASARQDMPKYLFPSKTAEDRVQLAYFSDFYCPYCRVLSGQVIDIAADTLIDVSWHETPIFGPASVLAARGAIAAGQQGAYQAYHKRLNRTPVQVTTPFLLQLADRLGLDPEQFESDMNSAATQNALDHAAALAQIFRFVGTPALVVGRTVVQGKISPTNLRQLIAREATDGHFG